MRTGRFRYRIAIQSATATADQFGEPDKAWSTDVTIWADIQPLKGRERFEYQQVKATLSHKIKIRARTITPRQRVLYGTRVFDIHEVVNVDERGHEMYLIASEAV